MLGFSSLWLRRYGPVIAIFHLSLALIAIHFGITVLVGGSPMTPEIYGPAVYAIPAWIWAMIQVSAQMIGAVGACLRGRRGGAMLIISGALILPLYALLGAAASMTGQGTIVTAACLWLLMPATILSIIAGIGAVANGR